MHRASLEQRRVRRATRLADAAALAMCGLLLPLARHGRFAPGPSRRRRRLVLVQLDGVSRGRLERALGDGLMPALAARLAAGSHVLSSCRSGAPPSTPAFQAGLFYGVAPSVPGFVWFDRATGREVRMDRTAEVSAMEERLARRAPGLLRGGTSYFSIFSGGAAQPRFCISGLAGDLGAERAWLDERLVPGDALASALARTVTAARAALRVGLEVGRGVADGLRWAIARRRLKHEPRFLAHRVLLAALLRELAVQGIQLDISRGVPAIYVDFLGFDEYAHRRGPESRAARRNLPAADAALAAIFAAAEAVPELGYDVYVLSDHGNVPTRPFEELAGIRLPELVARAMCGAPGSRGARPGTPDRGLLPGRALRGGEACGVATAEAGDLAHVYFLRDDGPLPLDAIRARHWRVLAALAANPAVGLLATRGGRRGFALVRGAVLDLADPLDVARIPHPDPPLVATYLSDLVSVPEAGDLVVLGWRGPGRDVVAYAWEFGSHGGIAPEELESFVVHPAACRFPFERVVRPSELYRFFERAYRRRAERIAPARDAVGRAREAPSP